MLLLRDKPLDGTRSVHVMELLTRHGLWNSLGVIESEGQFSLRLQVPKSFDRICAEFI